MFFASQEKEGEVRLTMENVLWLNLMIISSSAFREMLHEQNSFKRLVDQIGAGEAQTSSVRVQHARAMSELKKQAEGLQYAACVFPY